MAVKIPGSLRVGQWAKLSSNVRPLHPTDLFHSVVPKWSDVPIGDHVLCKIQHNFLSSDTRQVPCQFPFSWLIKQRLDEMSTGVFRLNSEGNFVLLFTFLPLFVSSDYLWESLYFIPSSSCLITNIDPPRLENL